MPVHIRYRPNNSDFGRLMISDQTQDLANQGARRGVVEAWRLAASLDLPKEYIRSIGWEEGPTVTMGGNPRRTARVHAAMPFIEFGSGRKRPRPQGGSSPAYRVLGRVAPKIGNPPIGGGGPR